MSIRAGVIGIGSFYSYAFAGALKTIPGVELLAAAHLGQSDRTLKLNTNMGRDEYSSRYGVRLYERWEEMVEAENLTMALVCAADTLKPIIGAEVIRCGLDTYFSKPLTHTLAGIDRLLAASRGSQALISTLQPARYDGAIREAYRRIEEGEIGEVISARAWVQHGRAPSGRNLEDNVECGEGQGGTEFTLGMYASGLLNWFLGSEPARVYCEADNFNSPGFAHPDSMKGTVRCRDRKIGSMDIYWAASCDAPLWEIEVAGKEGILRTQQSVYEGYLFRSSAPRTVPFYRHQNDVILAAMQSWAASCLNRTAPDLTLEAAARDVETCAGWQLSAREGRVVELPLKRG